MTKAKPVTDLRFGELAVLWPLAALMLVMGVAPSLWIAFIENRSGPPAAQGSSTNRPAPSPAAVARVEEAHP
jgi:NADH-quinone oxidoreductase subunit M